MSIALDFVLSAQAVQGVVALEEGSISQKFFSRFVIKQNQGPQNKLCEQQGEKLSATCIKNCESPEKGTTELVYNKGLAIIRQA